MSKDTGLDAHFTEEVTEAGPEWQFLPSLEPLEFRDLSTDTRSTLQGRVVISPLCRWEGGGPQPLNLDLHTPREIWKLNKAVISPWERSEAREEGRSIAKVFLGT